VRSHSASKVVESKAAYQPTLVVRASGGFSQGVPDWRQDLEKVSPTSRHMWRERRTQVKTTYKAVEVSAPGILRVVERLVSEPGTGQVRIRVEACGICHTDAATVTGVYPGLTRPRVPGHEVVGRVEALGPGVSRWKIGQRVGVGLIGGEDGVCEPCRRGDLVNCQNHPVVLGVTVDGGYAEVMIAEARGIAAISDELSSAEAAALLCAGITTYNALRNAGLRSGDLVAVQGIGGLGHLGIQFARHMGFRTVAIGRGREKEKLAKDLGRARLRRCCRRRCRGFTAAHFRGQSDSRNSDQW
jgi:D-arabinose 1-dehydrogenase-like Zn-dependent alcohol dehydrogenase